MFGMSELLGPRRFGTDQNEVFLGRDFSSNADYSEDTAAQRISCPFSPRPAWPSMRKPSSLPSGGVRKSMRIT